ncbi:MAG: DUF429 domain-containing protein [Pseudomonadota bacterium]
MTDSFRSIDNQPQDRPAAPVCYGVDGCRGGWVCVRPAENRLSFSIHSRFLDVIKMVSSDARLFVDIPIGLQDKRSPDRACDREARRLLRPKRSASVFNAPIRDILYEASHHQASIKSKRLIGKGISRQTYNIMNKIIEVDEAIRSGKTQGLHIKEAHPELCFYGLNKLQPMQYNKRTQEGYQQRIALLAKFIPEVQRQLEETLETYPRRLVARDDMVDATVIMLAATMHQHCMRIPERPVLDTAGIAMEILFPVA